MSTTTAPSVAGDAQARSGGNAFRFWAIGLTSVAFLSWLSDVFFFGAWGLQPVLQEWGQAIVGMEPFLSLSYKQDLVDLIFIPAALLVSFLSWKSGHRRAIDVAILVVAAIPFASYFMENLLSMFGVLQL